MAKGEFVTLEVNRSDYMRLNLAMAEIRKIVGPAAAVRAVNDTIKGSRSDVSRAMLKDGIKFVNSKKRGAKPISNIPVKIPIGKVNKRIDIWRAKLGYRDINGIVNVRVRNIRAIELAKGSKAKKLSPQGNNFKVVSKVKLTRAQKQQHGPRIEGIRIAGVFLPRAFVNTVSTLGGQEEVLIRQEEPTWTKGHSGWMYHSRRHNRFSKPPKGARTKINVVMVDLRTPAENVTRKVIEQRVAKMYPSRFDYHVQREAARGLARNYLRK